MSIKLLSKDDRREFISQHDDSEPKSVFIVKPISHKERIAIEKHLSRNDYSKTREVGFSITERNLLYVRLGLIDWKNVTGADGKPVPFDSVCDNFSIPGLPPRKALREDAIERLPSSLISELGEEIEGSNKIAEDEEKN